MSDLESYFNSYSYSKFLLQYESNIAMDETSEQR